jgi:hypothetical protein
MGACERERKKIAACRDPRVFLAGALAAASGYFGFAPKVRELFSGNRVETLPVGA